MMLPALDAVTAVWLAAINVATLLLFVWSRRSARAAKQRNAAAIDAWVDEVIDTAERSAAARRADAVRPRREVSDPRIAGGKRRSAPTRGAAPAAAGTATRESEPNPAATGAVKTTAGANDGGTFLPLEEILGRLVDQDRQTPATQEASRSTPRRSTNALA